MVSTLITRLLIFYIVTALPQKSASQIASNLQLRNPMYTLYAPVCFNGIISTAKRRAHGTLCFWRSFEALLSYQIISDSSPSNYIVHFWKLQLMSLKLVIHPGTSLYFLSALEESHSAIRFVTQQGSKETVASVAVSHTPALGEQVQVHKGRIICRCGPILPVGILVQVDWVGVANVRIKVQ